MHSLLYAPPTKFLSRCLFVRLFECPSGCGWKFRPLALTGNLPAFAQILVLYSWCWGSHLGFYTHINVWMYCTRDRDQTQVCDEWLNCLWNQINFMAADRYSNSLFEINSVSENLQFLSSAWHQSLPCVPKPQFYLQGKNFCSRDEKCVKSTCSIEVFKWFELNIVQCFVVKNHLQASKG